MGSFCTFERGWGITGHSGTFRDIRVTRSPGLLRSHSSPRHAPGRSAAASSGILPLRTNWVRFAHSQESGASWGKSGHIGACGVQRLTRRRAPSDCQRTHPTARKTARLLLPPNRARFGQQSRTTARVSPEKRGKKFRILVSPFARFERPSLRVDRRRRVDARGWPRAGVGRPAAGRDGRRVIGGRRRGGIARSRRRRGRRRRLRDDQCDDRRATQRRGEQTGVACHDR